MKRVGLLGFMANAMLSREPLIPAPSGRLVATGGRNKKYGIPSNNANGGRPMFKQNRRAQIKANKRGRR